MSTLTLSAGRHGGQTTQGKLGATLFAQAKFAAIAYPTLMVSAFAVALVAAYLDPKLLQPIPDVREGQTEVVQPPASIAPLAPAKSPGEAETEPLVSDITTVRKLAPAAKFPVGPAIQFTPPLTIPATMTQPEETDVSKAQGLPPGTHCITQFDQDGKAMATRCIRIKSSSAQQPAGK